MYDIVIVYVILKYFPAPATFLFSSSWDLYESLQYLHNFLSYFFLKQSYLFSLIHKSFHFILSMILLFFTPFQIASTSSLLMFTFYLLHWETNLPCNTFSYRTFNFSFWNHFTFSYFFFHFFPCLLCLLFQIQSWEHWF